MCLAADLERCCVLCAQASFVSTGCDGIGVCGGRHDAVMTYRLYSDVARVVCEYTCDRVTG